MKKSPLIVMALAALGVGAGCFSEGDAPLGPADDSPALSRGAGPASAGTASYEITIENLTADTGDGGTQVFSPPVFAVHRPNVSMWRAGEMASAPVAGVAEDALNDALVDALDGADGVLHVMAGDAVIPPGASATYTVDIERGYRRLSGIFMLVNTNDGFAGLDSIMLPARGEKQMMLHAYDAGSEENTELIAHIPGPCCGNPGAGPDTAMPIHPHPGLQGTGDLDVAKWGWEGPVARVTIRRLP